MDTVDRIWYEFQSFLGWSANRVLTRTTRDSLNARLLELVNALLATLPGLQTHNSVMPYSKWINQVPCGYLKEQRKGEWIEKVGQTFMIWINHGLSFQLQVYIPCLKMISMA